ncbi:MAG: integrase [Paracoccaceae bacterium]|jgi:integrase
MSLKIYTRGKIWHYRGTATGRRLRGSTGTTDKAIAQRIASEAETKQWQSHLDGPGAHVTFAQAATAYIEAEKPTRFVLPILDFWKDTKIRDISAGAIKQAAIKLYPKAKPVTRNRQVITPTVAIINHAAELEWCNPIKAKKFKEGTPKKKDPVDWEWVAAFVDQAIKDDLPHLAAICLFMFATGARVGEATEILWGDMDLMTETVTINQGKTDVVRVSHLPGPVVVALANIGGNRDPGEKVFGYAAPDSIRKVWDHVIDRAGIKRLTPHCCRHGFATVMLRAGYDVKTVAKLGGWKTAKIVLDHYAHALDDITVTDVLFDTNLTQHAGDKPTTVHKQKENKK